MSPDFQNSPEYLNPDTPIEKMVELFNQRKHPDDMTPRERGQEMAALQKAPVPLLIFQLRLAELAGPGAITLDIAFSFDELAMDAVDKPGIISGQPLRQVTVEECLPKKPPPLGPLKESP
jgi:hypothetical protein